MPHGTDRLSARLRCERHRWPEVHNILRHEQQPHAAHTIDEGRTIVLSTTQHAARALRHLTTPDPSAPRWEALTAPQHQPDELDAALTRAREQSRQGRRAGAKRL